MKHEAIGKYYCLHLFKQRQWHLLICPGDFFMVIREIQLQTCSIRNLHSIYPFGAFDTHALQGHLTVKMNQQEAKCRDDDPKTERVEDDREEDITCGIAGWRFKSLEK